MQVINVSPSLLADVLTCETRGWTRHVKGYTSRGDAIKAVAGQAFHAAIAVFFGPEPIANESRRVPDALAKFHETYDPAFAVLPADCLPDQAYLPDNLHRVLARWLEMHPAGAVPWRRVLTVEEAFQSREWTIARFDDTRVRLIVRPDLIVEDHNGMVRWVDTKTTGWRISDPGWRRQLRLSLQVALYTDAVAQRFPDRAVLGGWFNAIELRTLPASDRPCKEHRRPYAECGAEHAKYEFIEAMTTEERLAQAVSDAQVAAATFVRIVGSNVDGLGLNMNGTASGSCRFCPAAEWCEAGRYPETLESFLQYSPWPIEEGQRV